MSKKIIFILFVVFASQTIMAQEFLKPLNCNLNYLYSELLPPSINNYLQPNKKNQIVSLSIPFLDDFYYANSNNYPNQLLWQDSSTYINIGYPIAPPSFGVATFDGLNKFGYPYLPSLNNLNLTFPADTLESQPINLHQTANQILLPSDSIALSFYYQARGNGDPPELNDSLILDFYQPVKNKWISRVWFSKGNFNSNINDSVFKRGFVAITDTNFLKDGFKFRFRNWATGAGNFDHWHLDYVYLNKNRRLVADTAYNDISFSQVPSSFLKNYSAMPFEQYKPFEMAIKNSVRIKNNGVLTLNMTYENKLFDKNGILINSYSGGADNLPPFYSSGYSSITAHANPICNYTFSPFQDSADFTIKHFVYRSSGISSDFIILNDTIIQKQSFKNYFAFDDGSVESGYFINGQGGKMALKITVNVTDTLRALRVYFDYDGALTLAQSSYFFRPCVWADGQSGPGLIMLRDSACLPKYNSKGYNRFSEYKLTTPLVLNPGTYYIGIQQQVATGLTIGFDLNNNYKTNLYYNSGTGWNQSQINGSLMLRPVFGKYIQPPVLINENKKTDFIFFPNPSNDKITFRYDSQNIFSIQIYNAIGQLVINTNELTSSNAINNYQINTSQLSNGIYFLIINENNKSLQQHKLIIQH